MSFGRCGTRGVDCGVSLWIGVCVVRGDVVCGVSPWISVSVIGRKVCCDVSPWIWMIGRESCSVGGWNVTFCGDVRCLVCFLSGDGSPIERRGMGWSVIVS